MTNVGLIVESVDAFDGETTVVLRFASGTDAFGSLQDGNYEFNIDGAPLGVDANDDGAVGGVQTTDFHRLFGDSDGDRDVDGLDVGNFYRALFATPQQPSVYANAFNFDGDAEILGDLDDYLAFIARFGVVLADPN